MRLGDALWATRILGPRRLLELRRARDIGFVGIVRGHWTTRVLTTLLNVGFLDDLLDKGPFNLDDYSATRNFDPVILRAMCDYLVALRMLERQDSAYAANARGRFVVQRLRGLFESVYAYEDLIYNLEPLLKTQMKWGRDVHRKVQYMARGSGAGGRLFTFPLAIRLIEERGFKRVLDLACGDAAFLRQLCRTLPSVTGYGIDIEPIAIEEARGEVQRSGLEGRIHLVAEDIYRIGEVASQLRGVDAVTSFYGFQEFLALGRGRLLDMLREYRNTFPGVTFVVCEVPKYSPEELRGGPQGVVWYQLFHALSGQSLATRNEWMALWHDAGFRQIEEKYLDFARTVFYLLR